MSLCTVCGYDKNPPGAEFCDACGAQLSISTANPSPPISQSPTFQEPVNQSFGLDPTVIAQSASYQEPINQSFAPDPMEIAPPPPPPQMIIPPPQAIAPMVTISNPPPPPELNTDNFPAPPPPIPMAVATPTTAKLIAKQPNAPIPEFPLESSNIIGIFNEEPVEIDLEGFYGNETVSSQHAEIYQENGFWMIKDLGSTNGIFIKPVGQTRFGARVSVPTILNSGDEIAIAKIRFTFQTL